MDSFPAQWNYLKNCVINQKMPQSMLFVGPLHCAIPQFVNGVIQLIFCKSLENLPCLSCADCQMVARNEHPDALWVKPDKVGGAIKIEQVRELQQQAYLTPQRVLSRVIIIDGADRMNTASANALLKILEEPPAQTLFILIAQQISTVLPTVLSRCHLLSFSAAHDLYLDNCLLLGQHYPSDSPRGLIVQQAEQLIDELIAVRLGQQHPCILAAEWSKLEPSALLWFLYLVYSQLQLIYISNTELSGPAAKQLLHCAKLLNPISVFEQIGKINNIIKKLNNNLNVNMTLILEDMLFNLANDSFQ